MIRPVSLLSVVTVAVALVAPAVASQAAVPKDPPGIKATVQYKRLAADVVALKAKRNTPATPARKEQMRRVLAGKHNIVVAKVNDLLAKRLAFIAYQSNKQLAAKVDRIDAKLDATLERLDEQLDAKVAKLRTAQRRAVATTKARYANQIDKLATQRATLRKKLAKTKDPAKRSALTQQIQAIQSQINELIDERTQAVNGVLANYAQRIDTVQARYAELIREAKAAAQVALKNARAVVKSRQEARNTGAHTRKANELALAKGLFDRGLAYIDGMPDPTAP